jgi:hypothetical protein
MIFLKRFKGYALVGLWLGMSITLSACGETESTRSVDYTDKTLINADKLLDKSGTFIMDDAAKESFKDSLSGGKISSLHAGQTMTFIFDDEGSLNVTNSIDGSLTIDCFVDYKVTATGVSLDRVWIPNGNVECPDPSVLELKMEITENYLLVKGAEFINLGFTDASGYAMVFRR